MYNILNSKCEQSTVIYIINHSDDSLPETSVTVKKSTSDESVIYEIYCTVCYIKFNL